MGGVTNGRIDSGLGVGRGSRGDLSVLAGRATDRSISDGISVSDLPPETEVPSSSSSESRGEASRLCANRGEFPEGDERRGEC